MKSQRNGLSLLPAHTRLSRKDTAESNSSCFELLSYTHRVSSPTGHGSSEIVVSYHFEPPWTSGCLQPALHPLWHHPQEPMLQLLLQLLPLEQQFQGLSLGSAPPAPFAPWLLLLNKMLLSRSLDTYYGSWAGALTNTQCFSIAAQLLENNLKTCVPWLLIEKWT